MASEYSPTILEAYHAVADWILRGLGQPPQWPRSAMEWLYYECRVMAKEYYHTIKELERIKPLPEIAQLLRYPATITHWLYFPESNFGHRPEYWAHGLSREQGIDFIETTIALLHCLRKEDPLCHDFRNVMLDRHEVEAILQRQVFIPVRDYPQTLALLPVLNTTLWHYAMLLQAGMRVHTVELHGPYPLTGGDLLFVREYSRLRPVDTWEFSRSLPYESVTFYEIYRDLQINIDMFGHYWTSEHPYAKLVRTAIQVDGGANLGPTEVEELCRVSRDVLAAGNAAIRHYTKRDWTRKSLEVSYLAIKPLKEALGEDPSPPADALAVADDEHETRIAEESGLHHIGLVGRAIGTLPRDKAVAEIANMHIKTIYDEWQRVPA